MSRVPKKLVFDGQVFQTPAWHRGMGKYSMELVSAISKLNNIKGYWKDIEIILSNKVPTEDSVREVLARKAPKVRVVELGLERNEYDNRPVAERNRKKIDKYLLDSSSGANTSPPHIDYMVLSLMQSEVAPAFSSHKFVNNYLLFYDLIPLMFYKTYLTDSLNQKSYLSKLSELLKADFYLAISKTIANDLSGLLGINSERVLSIDGAPIEHGSEAKEYEVAKPFILMPTGNDLRKNNKRGIEGFEKFNRRNNNKYYLVITSVFQDFEIAELSRLSDNVIFTGNISGQELEYLYQQTDALLFPTEYEGLGLPILEALEKEKPVACSDISVFREISDSAFWYFNPKNSDSIAGALEDATKAKRLPTREYKQVLKKFTWKRTAELFLNHSKNHVKKYIASRKPPIAIFSPASDESMEGVKLQQLYSELVRLSRPCFYMDTQGKKTNTCINYLAQIAGVKNIALPTSIVFPEETLPVYFIENSPNSAAVLLAALAEPGVLVLNTRDTSEVWAAAARRKLIHESRLKAEKKINASYHCKGLLVSLLANQKIIVTHDSSLEKELRKLVEKLGPRPKPVIRNVAEPTINLPYVDLKQDFSLWDYFVTVSKASQEYTFAEFADLLVNMAVTGKSSKNA